MYFGCTTVLKRNKTIGTILSVFLLERGTCMLLNGQTPGRINFVFQNSDPKRSDHMSFTEIVLQSRLTSIQMWSNRWSGIPYRSATFHTIKTGWSDSNNIIQHFSFDITLQKKLQDSKGGNSVKNANKTMTMTKARHSRQSIQWLLCTCCCQTKWQSNNIPKIMWNLQSIK